MKNIKIIKIKGGLGNQLFQYAYGRKLEIIDKKKVIFDTSFFYEKNKDVNRPFLLDKFDLNPHADFQNIKRNKVSKIFHKIKDTILLRVIKDYSFYQSEQYFAPIKNTILKEFTLKNPLSSQAQNISNNIRLQTNSVSIHIRRGDYVNNKHHSLCDLEYYSKSIQYIKSNTQNPFFFIYSDDIEWVKNNLQIENVIYVSNPNIKEYEEMILMSQCSHNIIANSTFSWWSAYLNRNPNKIVIAPKKWTTEKTADQLDILPSGWIKI